MRYSRLLLAPLVLLACCTQSKPPVPAPTATATATAVAAPTAAALAAKGVAQDYFDALKARRWRDAHARWTPEAAGPLPAFTNAMSGVSGFAGTAGAPSPIRSSGGTDYVLVEASTQTVDAGHGTVRRDGVVMLKRPSGGATPWRIWGTDIRVRRCKAGEQARGLGCVKA